MFWNDGSLFSGLCKAKFSDNLVVSVPDPLDDGKFLKYIIGTNLHRTRTSGWYDAGTDPICSKSRANLLLQPFDLWNWDARPGTPTLTTVTAGSLVMTGPT